MKRALVVSLLLLTLLGGRHVVRAATTCTFATASPESQGMSRARLDELQASLMSRKTRAYLVIRNDTVVDEWYASGYSRTTKHSTASTAKALVGGVATAVAISDGRLTLDAKVASYVPQWSQSSDSRKRQMTVRHLGSHTSGLQDAVSGTPFGDQFWDRLDPPDDPFTLSRDDAAILFTPGSSYQYSNPGFAMLSYVVTIRQGNLRTLLRDRIMRPIGVPDGEWSIGYGETVSVSNLPLVASWGGGSYSPRASACVARLMLRAGDWNGSRLISSSAVSQVTVDVGTPSSGGIGWWSNKDGSLGGEIPRDAFYAWGSGDQTVFIVPSAKLLLIRHGQTLASSPSDFRKRLAQYIFQPLLNAVLE
jgi:CubicO group peptidase (beta-lactamase class C family)